MESSMFYSVERKSSEKTSEEGKGEKRKGKRRKRSEPNKRSDNFNASRRTPPAPTRGRCTCPHRRPTLAACPPPPPARGVRNRSCAVSRDRPSICGIAVRAAVGTGRGRRGARGGRCGSWTSCHGGLRRFDMEGRRADGKWRHGL